MSSGNAGRDMETFFQLYRRWEQEQGSATQTSSVAPHHPTAQVQRPTPQRPSPSRTRVQSRRQPLMRTSPELSVYIQGIEDIKKRLDDMLATTEYMREVLEQNMAAMNEKIEKFQHVGRSILQQALETQPPNDASSQSQNPTPINQYQQHQPNTNNPTKTYQERTTTQLPTPFVPSSNHAQHLYPAPPSQAPESYLESNFIDYGGFDLSHNDPS